MKPFRRSILSAVAAWVVMGTMNAHADQPSTVADATATTAAAEAPAEAKPKGPTLSDVLGNSGIDVKGYLDASYIGHNQTPNSSVQVFDTSKSSFGLHQAGITISKTPKEGFGGLINLTAGSDAGIFCSYGACASGNGTTPGSGGNFDITQAFAQYATGSWTLIGGKFTTLAGAEVIDSSADTNITRSILFGKIPFTHTGVRVTDAVSDSTNLIAGVNNGWDQVSAMTPSKTVELGVTSAFTKDTSLALSGYVGTAPASFPVSTVAPMTGTRSLVDLVFTSNLTDALTLILNADYVSQEYAGYLGTTEKYKGLAGYLNYQINEQYRLSFRAEALKDDSGAALGTTPTAAGNTVKEMTLTVGYAPMKNVELRGELREDTANKPLFYSSDSAMTPATMTATSMTTLGVQAIYKF